jgi:hypothetical protein
LPAPAASVSEDHNRIPEIPRGGPMSSTTLVIAVIGIAIAGYIALNLARKKK